MQQSDSAEYEGNEKKKAEEKKKGKVYDHVYLLYLQPVVSSV